MAVLYSEMNTKSESKDFSVSPNNTSIFSSTK